MGLIHSRNLCKKEVDLFQQTPRRMHTRKARLVTREEKMGETEDQALTVHTKKNFKKKEKKENRHHNKKKDMKQKKL